MFTLKPASRSLQSCIPRQISKNKHLFDCLFLVGINLDVSNNQVPYIKMKYPTNTKIPQCVEYLCFPDAHKWSRNIEPEMVENDDIDLHYTITITSEDGQRKYIYCRRLKPEGESVPLPLSYCVMSSHKADEFYSRILQMVEDRHGRTHVEFSNFVDHLYHTRFPCKGERVVVRCMDEDSKIVRESDPRLQDLSLARMLECIKIQLFLMIFSSMLLERRIVLLSYSLSKLSCCMEALQTALLPFQWQHTIITVIPPTLISINDLCEAPTPYLIGLLKPDNSQLLQTADAIRQIIIVDIDDEKILKKVGDEQSLLPKQLCNQLRNTLELIHPDLETTKKNLTAREAFTRFFVELLSPYRRYIIRSHVDKLQKVAIQKDAFLRAVPINLRIFLESFIETAAFSGFISTHSYATDSRKLFEKRVIEYLAELKKGKDGGNKMLKTVEQIGDFFEGLEYRAIM